MGNFFNKSQPSESVDSPPPQDVGKNTVESQIDNIIGAGGKLDTLRERVNEIDNIKYMLEFSVNLKNTLDTCNLNVREIVTRIESLSTSNLPITRADLIDFENRLKLCFENITSCENAYSELVSKVDPDLTKDFVERSAKAIKDLNDSCRRIRQNISEIEGTLVDQCFIFIK
jgi:hypothetical protein